MDLTKVLESPGLVGVVAKNWPEGFTTEVYAGKEFSLLCADTISIVYGGKRIEKNLEIFLREVGAMIKTLHSDGRYRLGVVGALSGDFDVLYTSENISFPYEVFFNELFPRICSALKTIGIFVSRYDKCSLSFVWKPTYVPLPVYDYAAPYCALYREFEDQSPTCSAEIAVLGGETLKLHVDVFKDIENSRLLASYRGDVVWVLLTYLYTGDASLVYMSLMGVSDCFSVLKLALEMKINNLRSICINYICKELLTEKKWVKYAERARAVPELEERCKKWDTYFKALSRSDTPQGGVPAPDRMRERTK